MVLASLTGSLGDFSLDATFGDLSLDVSVEVSGFDLEALQAVVDIVEAIDSGSMDSVADGVLDLLADVLDQFPLVDDALAPLQAVLTLAEVVTGNDVTNAIEAVTTSVPDDLMSGLPALDQRFAAVAGLRSNPSVEAVLDLASPLLGDGFDLDGSIGTVGTHLGAIRELVNLIGGLMTIETASSDLRRLTELAAGMLVPSEIEATLRAVNRFEGAALADLFVGIDPGDGALVELLAGPVGEYSLAVRQLAAVIGRGMAFGEATLATADVDALAARIDAGSARLSETGLAPVRSAAEEVRGWLQPVLDIELPEAQEGLDGFADQVLATVSDLAGAVDRLDPTVLSGPVSAGFDEALSVFDQLAVAAEEVTTLLTNALGSIRGLVLSIDLTPVTDVLAAVVTPLAEALDTIGSLVGDAQAGIETSSQDAIDGLEAAMASLDLAAAAVGDAFGQLEIAIDGLGLDQLQETLEGLIDPVASTLRRAELAPYFDTANDVIGTAADVLNKVPFGLLPDDALADLAEAVEPVKSIDFQRDVADVLNAKMAEIVEALDSDVLTQIEAAYLEVIEFLDDLDPNTPLAVVEAEAFDPMLAAVRSVDLAGLIAPAAEALAPIQDAIASFDAVTEILAPIDDLLAEVLNQVNAFDPATLMAPIEAEIDTIRTEATDALQLDRWQGWLDEAERVIGDLAANVDLNGLVEPLDRAFDELIDEVGGGGAGRPGSEGGPSAIGTVIAGLLESSGLSIRATTFGTVTSWIGGVDGAAAVVDRLTAAADAIDQVSRAVASVDLTGLIAQLQPEHRAITTALAVHPADSPLRLRLDGELLASSPQELFGPLVESHAGYVASLTETASALRRLAASGRSPITAISQGLREALRPLQPVIDRLRAFLVRIGIDVASLSVREIVVELLSTFRPSVLLTPLVAAVDTLRSRLQSLAVDGLLGPIREAVTSVEAAVQALDIGFIRVELQSIHTEIIALVDGLNPSTVLGPALDQLDDLQQAVADFDPLAPVQAVVDQLTALIDQVDRDYRPTVLFGDITALYQRLVDALGALNVRDLLLPVLDAIELIQLQLAEGLDGSATALTALQASIPDESDLGGGASGGVSVSVGVGVG